MDYSDLQVLQSAAGFYIGRTYQGMPGTRESGYYPSEAIAEKDLKTGKFKVRDCMENIDSYDNGQLPDIRKPDVMKEEIQKAIKTAGVDNTRLARYLQSELTPRHFDSQVYIDVKSHYGTDHMYITSDHAEAVNSLTGRKTITMNDIKALKALGFSIYHKPEKRML